MNQQISILLIQDSCEIVTWLDYELVYEVKGPLWDGS